ncbi:unnamed protein product [Sympodiomycopsis kandeliae]
MATLASHVSLAHPTPPVQEPDGPGTGRSLPPSLLIIATVSSLSATVLSLIAIYSHLKRYLKPHLQRHVVRLLLIVPIYATSSLIGLFSLPAAFLIDLIRDLYEAFAIYCFFELLVAYLGGERSTLILLIGRRPIPHPWPFRIFLRDLDLSDPYTFLNIKRGILQYVQIKPILAISTVILKSIGRYEEGELKANNGYTYISTVYNISISLSLYALAIFWSALSHELEPFRPTSKFLTVKGVVFATFWQGWAISVLVASGLIKTIGPISDPSFLRLGLQDLLLTLEMPLFALGHMYAFSSKDYIDSWATNQARLPILYALRDALGGRDVLQDIKGTMRGTGYGYAKFEPARGAVHQGLARSRRLQAGLRYTQGGKGKYFLPDTSNPRLPGPISAVKTWVQAKQFYTQGYAPMTDAEAVDVLHVDPDCPEAQEQHQQDQQESQAEEPLPRQEKLKKLALGLEANLFFFADHHGDHSDDDLNAVAGENGDEEYSIPFGSRNPSEEDLYNKAKGLEHGDYAFPTISLGRKGDEEEQGEREWLLGNSARRGNRGGHSRVVSSERERRKRVEGWMDRVSSRLLGGRHDDSEDDSEGEEEERRQKGKSTSAKKGKKGKDTSAKKGKKSVWGGWGSDHTGEVEVDNASDDDHDQAEDSKSTDKQNTNKRSKDSQPAESACQSSPQKEEEHGAIDLITRDRGGEKRNRDIERRRGDPALITDRGGKKIFKTLYNGTQEMRIDEPSGDEEGKTAVVVRPPQRDDQPGNQEGEEGEQDSRSQVGNSSGSDSTDTRRNGTDSKGARRDDSDSGNVRQHGSDLKIAEQNDSDSKDTRQNSSDSKNDNTKDDSQCNANGHPQQTQKQPIPDTQSSGKDPSPDQSDMTSKDERQPPSSSSSSSSPQMEIYHRHQDWKWGGMDDTIDQHDSSNPWS